MIAHAPCKRAILVLVGGAVDTNVLHVIAADRALLRDIFVVPDRHRAVLLDNVFRLPLLRHFREHSKPPETHDSARAEVLEHNTRVGKHSTHQHTFGECTSRFMRCVSCAMGISIPEALVYPSGVAIPWQREDPAPGQCPRKYIFFGLSALERPFKPISKLQSSRMWERAGMVKEEGGRGGRCCTLIILLDVSGVVERIRRRIDGRRTRRRRKREDSGRGG